MVKNNKNSNIPYHIYMLISKKVNDKLNVKETKDMEKIFQKYDVFNGQTEKNQFTLLHYAALDNDVKVVEYLLNKEADPNIATEDKKLPIHLTTDFNVIKLLLEKDPSKKLTMINAQTYIGLTPLHRAVMDQDYETVKYLLDNEADPNLETVFGDSAWDFADNEEAEIFIDYYTKDNYMID